MHFRFRFDRDGFHKEFGGRFGHRGARWAAFARAMADEFGGDGPARPRRRRFGAEALKYLVLHLLKTEPRHGYELIKAIESLSAGLYSPSPGMIYPLLNLLADEGLITELAGEEGRRRYAITDAGRAALDAAEAQLQEALARLAEMAGARQERSRVHESMGALKAAVRGQLAGKESNADRAERIAEILDTATRAVEALDG